MTAVKAIIISPTNTNDILMNSKSCMEFSIYLFFDARYGSMLAAPRHRGECQYQKSPDDTSGRGALLEPMRGIVRSSSQAYPCAPQSGDVTETDDPVPACRSSGAETGS